MRNQKFDLWIGFAIPLAVNLLAAAIYRPVLIFGWVFQWVYIIPLAIVLRHRGKVRMAQGIWMMAGAYSLVNLALCGYLVSTLSTMG